MKFREYLRIGSYERVLNLHFQKHPQNRDLKFPIFVGENFTESGKVHNYENGGQRRLHQLQKAAQLKICKL